MPISEVHACWPPKFVYGLLDLSVDHERRRNANTKILSLLRRVKDWVQLFCAHCLNYPGGGRYRTINRKAVVSM